MRLREYRLLVPYLVRYRAAYLFGAACLLASVALKLLVPWLFGDAVDELRRLGETDGVPAGRVRELVGRSALLIAATAGAVAVTRTGSRLAILGTSRRVVHDLRGVLFDRLLALAPSFYVRNPTGQILSRCINDMQNVQGLMGPVVLYLAEVSTLFVFALAMMLRLDVGITLLALAPFPFFLYAARRIAVRVQEGSRAAQNALGELASKVDESLSGQLVIKTLALEDFDAGRFESRAREYRRLNLRVVRERAKILAGMSGLASLSILVVLALGAPRVGAGLTLGELLALVLYVQMLATPTRTLGFVISSLRRGAAALGRIEELLESEEALREPAGAAAEMPAPEGLIELRGLTITYPPLAEQPHLSGSLPEELGPEAPPDRARTVLEDVSITVPPGTTLGIVGHTGAGKTTLVRAVSRQLEIAPGQVFLDGRDVTTLPLRALRRHVGFVPQDPFLFSATLAENVALGRPDATRAEIEAAVAAAQLAKDLGQLPEGLDTVVGERGVKLSGGQRQRAALARVLLLAPRVLVLDDTLSAVDAQTADEILAALRPFTKERTTLIVSHRLSTVRHADQIVVLEEGRVVERGTHAGLMALGGRYAATWARQEEQEREREEARRRERRLARELALEEGRG